MKKYAFLWPHNWLQAKGLARVYWTLFYADAAFTLYTAYHCAAAWLTPAAKLAVHSAPLRQLYTFALLQALFLGVLLAGLARFLDVLHRLVTHTEK